MWAQAINVGLGLWLTAASAVLAYGRPAATLDHIVGPLIATFACIALWEATRSVRWANLPLGLSLLVAPWLLDAPAAAKINSMLIGMLIALLSCVSGVIRHRFDRGWSMLWEHSPPSKDKVPSASLAEKIRSDTMSSEKPVMLITGSSGLIGSRLADALADRYQVVGLDVKPPVEGDERAAFIECDLTEMESVSDAMRQVRNQFGRALASVVHLAAYYDFSGEPSPLYEELTVEGTRRLLLSLTDFDAEQFVFSSSLLVMKPVEEGEEVSETSPAEAAWDYPQSKLAAEDVIRKLHDGIPAVILRIAGVYDEQGHSVPIAQQISRIHQKQLESYFFPGDVDHGQAFVHLDDLIDCFVKTIDKRGQLGDYELLLVAEPDVMSYDELQDRIGDLLHGREWPTIRIPKAMAKAGAWVKDKLASEEEPAFIKPWMVDLADQHYPVAIDRARAKLGWEPKRRLRETLDEIISSLKNDPQAWYRENGVPPPELE